MLHNHIFVRVSLKCCLITPGLKALIAQQKSIWNLLISGPTSSRVDCIFPRDYKFSHPTCLFNKHWHSFYEEASGVIFLVWSEEKGAYSVLIYHWIPYRGKYFPLQDPLRKEMPWGGSSHSQADGLSPILKVLLVGFLIPTHQVSFKAEKRGRWLHFILLPHLSSHWFALWPFISALVCSSTHILVCSLRHHPPENWW